MTWADDQLEELVRKYAGLIRRVIWRVGGHTTAKDRDDIEQQIVVNLWRQLEREQTISHPASYIYRAAVRETVRILRREQREPVSGDVVDFAGGLPAGPSSVDEADRAELRDAVASAIAGLHEDRRRAVRAHLAGYDVRDIMQAYGWSYQRARNLVARGMADLRSALAKKGING